MRLNKINHQKGSLTVMALFVIIILSFLGVALSNQLTTSSQSLVYEVHGTRAYLAAQTGLEILAATSFPLNSVNAQCNIPSPGNTLNVSGVNGLQNCAITTMCSSQIVTENGVDTLIYYQFESTGVCQAGTEWTSRTLARDGVVRL
ncbi:type II secretory pathway component [Alteromonas sp. 5E99-2]|uniref:type II secretory pathway component n=1 Tax=Alteromonas sp. 5E99-2 TaxID=2817683 RepID=UPI001A98A6B5|nr:type II secretory pathway component [Alteromonas sp. 5E99-2]MBO1255838.1 type II secretory pathway component [Alteromonas sp. 5E99-2]